MFLLLSWPLSKLMNVYEDYNRAKKVNHQLAITLISSPVSVRDFIKLGAVILHTCNYTVKTIFRAKTYYTYN